MENFYVFEASDNMFQRVIVMKTCEPPFDYLPEISDYLKTINFKGSVVIDQLLHSGNTDERFIVGCFDGDQFQKNSFAFKDIDRKSVVRKYMCEVLRDDPEALELTILNQAQKRLISRGCYI